MFRLIDRLLDRFTMYRLLIYYLIGLLIAAAVLSQLGYLHYSPLAIGLSAGYLVVVCWVTNQVFKSVWDVPINRESTHITALILALIITPVSTPFGMLFLTAAGGLAVASKYLLAPARKHVFNPAAIAVLLTSLGAGQTASWWVGSAPLLPFVLVGGLLLVRKIHRMQMVFSFIGSALVATIIYSLIGHQNLLTLLHQTILSSALFFLAFVMLTEPLTSPTTRSKQRWYGVLTGLLFPPQVHLLSFYSTPELVLIIGNVYAYFVTSHARVVPRLISKQQISPSVVDFVFKPDKPFIYKPGQYMEWTLSHDKADSRGERRYLTLASSPTEPELRLGVKFYKDGSTYKKEMLTLNPATQLTGTQLAGDFVLPPDPATKLAFISGGIGVTPYRSMLKYLIDTNEARSITMLYAASAVNEFVYTDVIEQARQQLGVNTVYVTPRAQTVPSTHYRAGHITTDLIKAEIPDYAERLFYISGSVGLVKSVEKSLRELGVPYSHIKVDFFSGYTASSKTN